MTHIHDDGWRRDPVTLDGLYVHRRALRGIETFKAAGVVGLHPMYLVGMTLPGHRGGPGRIALVLLADGRVIAATRRSWSGRGKKDINDIIEYDEDLMTADELRRYTTIWRETFGGFAGMVVDTASDGEAAHELIRDFADSAGVLKAGVEHCRRNPPQPAGRWDPADAMVMAEFGTVCAVHGFTPDHSLVASLGVADEVKRAMTLSPLPPTDPMSTWIDDIIPIDPTIPGLVAEAWAVRLASPRAAVALLRTAAERVVPHFGVSFAASESSLHARIQRLKQEWAANPPPLQRSALAREEHRRSRILAALDSLREVGNLVHQVDPVSLDDASWSHSVLEVLLEAALSRGTLDTKPGSLRT